MASVCVWGGRVKCQCLHSGGSSLESPSGPGDVPTAMAPFRCGRMLKKASSQLPVSRNTRTISKTGGGDRVTRLASATLEDSPHMRPPTVVHRQNLPAVHFHKTAEGELSVCDASLLRTLQGDPLATQTNKPQRVTREVAGSADVGSSRTHLVVVVVHQTSDHVDLLQVQFVQHVGRV